MYPNEQIERVAKAILSERTAGHVDWRDLTQPFRQEYLDQATAALDAAGDDSELSGTRELTKSEVWQALNEVVTNGQWSGGGDFCGQWCIDREVYEMAAYAANCTMVFDAIHADTKADIRSRVLDVLKDCGADFLVDSSSQVADKIADIVAPPMAALIDVLACWKSELDMSGRTDRGAFRQDRLRALRPRLMAIVERG